MRAGCAISMAVDDAGNPFTPSSDPLLEAAAAYVKDYKLDDTPKDLSRLILCFPTRRSSA